MASNCQTRVKGGPVDYGSSGPNDPAYEYPHTVTAPVIQNALPPTQKKRFPFGAAGGFIAAVLLIAAGVGAYYASPP